MEQEPEFLAKILGKEIDILLSNQIIIIGRGDSLELSNEAKDYLQTQANKAGENEYKKVDLGEDQLISKIAGLIKYNSNKKCFFYTNLSKNLQLVNSRILSRFENTKLKNKSSICIGNKIFFFIYSKGALLLYYKQRIDELSIRNTKSENVLGSILQSKIFPMPQSNGKVKESLSTPVHLSARGQSKKKRVFNKKPQKEDALNSGMPYAFENMFKPPTRNNLENNDDILSMNIIDDLIEAPMKNKASISSKSVLIN